MESGRIKLVSLSILQSGLVSLIYEVKTRRCIC